MNRNTCGCCEGIDNRTPKSIANRPGLDVLSTRIGRHADFFESMLASLTGLELEDVRNGEQIRPLDKLTSREGDDPSIALLDAWAVLAHVLGFYGERIANEGYLRSATERRSLLELARLVGYRPRPSVAASVYLAFSLDNEVSVEIPAGTRAQSMPEPGELPQFFETAEPLDARVEWDQIKPRATRPILIDSLGTWASADNFFFEGNQLGLEANAPILFDTGVGTIEGNTLRFVVASESEENRTRVSFRTDPGPISISVTGENNTGRSAFGASFGIGSLLVQATPQIANASRLVRDNGQTFDANGGIATSSHTSILGQASFF